jgi:hypothetical protein
MKKKQSTFTKSKVKLIKFINEKEGFIILTSPELRRQALFNCFEDLRNACDGYTDFSNKTNEEIKKETLKNIDYFLSEEYLKSLSLNTKFIQTNKPNK